jgi:fatty-acyl-CoA synthase
MPLLGKCIGEVMRESAQQHPDRDALIVRHQGQRYTYRELDQAVDCVARGLISLGVQKGDRVGIWATNCAEWVLTQFATARIGAILVNINPSNRIRELEYVLHQSECQLLILGTGFRDIDYLATVQELCSEVKDSAGNVNSKALPELRKLVLVANDAPQGFLSWRELLQSADLTSTEQLAERESQLGFDDAIDIQYTSGTTGFPKGATLSHHNIVNNALLVTNAMHLTYRDRLCIPVPFYHCFGMVMANMGCVVRAATMVVPAASFDPEATLRAISEERCTALYGVPTMFIAQLDHPDFARFELNSLRTGIMAGSPCPAEIMKRVVNQMHCREITIAYGLTESSPVITQTTTDDPLERRVTTVGRILPHTELKIVDPQSGATVPRGIPGELCTRGYNVMKSYYKNPEATRAAIDEDGWLHTGDLGVLDSEGYTNITGRAKDMIIRGGENIYPREVEEFLYTCPGVSAVQVFGVPDAKYGEQVVAWIKLREGSKLRAADIQEFCKGQIARFKIPQNIKFVDEFPMTVTGKVQKYKMREQSIHELGLEAEAKSSMA